MSEIDWILNVNISRITNDKKLLFSSTPILFYALIENKISSRLDNFVSYTDVFFPGGNFKKFRLLLPLCGYISNWRLTHANQRKGANAENGMFIRKSLKIILLIVKWVQQWIDDNLITIIYKLSKRLNKCKYKMY